MYKLFFLRHKLTLIRASVGQNQSCCRSAFGSRGSGTFRPLGFGSLKSKTSNKIIPKFPSKNLINNFEKNENCTTKFLFFSYIRSDSSRIRIRSFENRIRCKIVCQTQKLELTKICPIDSNKLSLFKKKPDLNLIFSNKKCTSKILCQVGLVKYCPELQPQYCLRDVKHLHDND